MLRHDYSFPERALGFWFPLTLGILAVTSLGLRYVTNPISCWVPAHFLKAHVQYTHDVCFQSAVIHSVAMDLPINRTRLLYYTYHQWVPFALGVAAISCLLPYALWRMLSGLLWLDIHAMVQTLADNQRHNAAGRHVMLRDSAHVLQAGLRGGNWMLTAAVLGRKALACMVCVIQVIVIVLLFKPQLSARVPGRGETKGAEEEESEDEVYSIRVPLPEVFVCKTTMMHLLENVQEYAFQCMLPLTKVYSKGFTFLFYFFLLLALGFLLDILLTVARLAIPGLRDSRLKRYLAISQVDADPQMTAVMSRFLDTLGLDGRLVMAVTADVCGPVAAADLTNHLWVTFKASSRPGVVFAGPPPGPVSGVPVSTVPPLNAAAATSLPPAAAAPPSAGDPAAIPLLRVGGGEGKMTAGAQA